MAKLLLKPKLIFMYLVEDYCLNEGINIHYTVNITGHGWRSSCVRHSLSLTWLNICQKTAPNLRLYPATWTGRRQGGIR